MCGLDIDVPAIAWNSSSGTIPGSGNGELPARIWMPGAVISGLMMSSATGSGPREEKSVIDGALGHVDGASVVIDAVAGLLPVAASMYPLLAGARALWGCALGGQGGAG